MKQETLPPAWLVCVWGGVLFQRIGLRTRNPVFQTVQKSACTVHFEATQARFAAAGQEQAWGFAITGVFFLVACGNLG